MNQEAIRLIAPADRAMTLMASALVDTINTLARLAWIDAPTFYQELGTNAAAAAARHKALIDCLNAIAPDRVGAMVWPPYEVIYLTSGCGIPTRIPFDPARQTLVVADEAAAAVLEAEIIAELPPEA